MAVIGYYRTGNTLRTSYWAMDLGTDPITGLRTITTETVTMIMRNRDAAVPVAVVRDVTVLDSGPYTIDGTEYDQIFALKPEDGDFDEAGTWDAVFDITDVSEDVDTVPNKRENDYQWIVGLKPGDTGYNGPA